MFLDPVSYLVLLAPALIVLLIGLSLSLRTLPPLKTSQGLPLVRCGTCQNWTQDYIHFSRHAEAYEPLCRSCQEHLGICDRNGHLDPVYTYQVREMQPR